MNEVYTVLDNLNYKYCFIHGKTITGSIKAQGEVLCRF
jgi:hypothetical protein